MEEAASKYEQGDGVSVDPLKAQLLRFLSRLRFNSPAIDVDTQNALSEWKSRNLCLQGFSSGPIHNN